MYADPTFQKIATEAFFDELASLLVESRSKMAAAVLDAAYESILDSYGDDFVKQAAEDDLEELIKVAVVSQLVKKFPVLGMSAGQGLKQLGGQVAAAARPVTQAVGTAVRPVTQAVQKVTGRASEVAGRGMSAIAHPLQRSQNKFISGVGDTLHHKAQTGPIRGFINAPGTLAEAVTASGMKNYAAPALASAGGKMHQRFGGADLPTSHPGWAAQQAQKMRGGPAESLRQLGGKMQTSFAPGGSGHHALTKTLPRAMEYAPGIALGAAGIHTLPGMMGNAALGAVGGGAKALGMQGLSEGIGHAIHGMGAVGNVAHHGVADVVGSHAQDAIAKRITPARGMMPYGAVPPRIQPRLPSPQPAALPAPA